MQHRNNMDSSTGSRTIVNIKSADFEAPETDVRNKNQPSQECSVKTQDSLVLLDDLTRNWEALSVEKEQFCSRFSHNAAKAVTEKAQSPWGDFLQCLEQDTTRTRASLQRTLCAGGAAATNISAVQVREQLYITSAKDWMGGSRKLSVLLKFRIVVMQI
jgi:hypothetical protein